MSVYNPLGLSCHNPDDFISLEEFTEANRENTIFLPKVSESGAQIMYCLIRSELSLTAILDIKRGGLIPGLNIDDIRYIRDQITDKSVRDEIDEYITDQSIVLTGPSKGFMLFLRRVICCLHSADKSTKTEAYKKLHPTADEQDDVRSTILLPIVSEINRKIQSLPPSEAIALKKLPFVVPGDVFSSYPTFGKFLEQTAHCSEGLVGQLVDFYNFNKRKYFTNDDTVIGINRNLGCSAAFLDSYCRSSNDPFNTSSRINNSNITAANLNSYSTQTNSNNDSKNYMINMSKAGKNVLGGKKTQRKRKNKRQTKRR